jgi:nicotinamidase/pyrazinamidase
MTKASHAANHCSFLSSHIMAGEDKKLGDVCSLNNGAQYRLVPDHCVEGTEGAQMPTGLVTEASDYVVVTGTNPAVPGKSAFRDLQPEVEGEVMTGLSKHLRSVNVTDVYVVGLGLEEMVQQTALDAKKIGFTSNLLVDGCLSWDEVEGGRSRIALESAGVELLHSVVLMEVNGNRRMQASTYIEENGIHVILQKLTAALVYHQPENPKEFLIGELQNLQKESEANLGLLTDEDLGTMFKMLDPIKKGQLTGKQVLQGLKGLAVTPAEPVDPTAVFDEAQFKELVLSSS